MIMNERITKTVVITLVILFGINSWVGTNSIWVELPLIVPVLPEQWYLPSYLAVIVQFANIGPIIYGILKWLKPNLPVNIIILCFIYSVGCMSMILVGLFWDRVTDIFDSPHSVALFVLVFFISLTNCSSGVVSLPYMARFKSNYITAYFVGMGISGMLPSLLALIQGAGSVNCVYSNDSNSSSTVNVPPVFTSSTFFYIIFGIMLISCLSFIGLNQWTAVKTCYIIEKDRTVMQSKDTTVGLGRLSILFSLNIVICALGDSVLDAIQTFTSMPYGIVAFHLAVVLTEISNPIGSFIAFFIRIRKVLWFLATTFVVILFSIYLFVLASLSPDPPMKNSAGGTALMIAAWVVTSGSISYTRTSLANYLQEEGGEKYLFYMGAFTQVGSFIGAVIMFPLINVYYVFKSAPSC